MSHRTRSLLESLNLFSTDHEERIILFTEASKSDPDLPFDPLLRCVHSCSQSGPPRDTSLRILETQDDFVQLKTSQILTVLLRFVHNIYPAQHGDSYR